MTFKAALAEIIHDRVVQAGTGTSGVSLLGAKGLESASVSFATYQPYVAFFAALFGGLSAFATFVYVCLKIRRMLRQPNSLD
jgi:ABC-type uncharacterized transport system permease subunit